VFVGVGDDLEPDSMGSSDEERFTATRCRQELPLGVGEVERLHELFDGLGCLPHQDLGGVGDDRAAEVGAEHIGGVLGDDGDAGVAFCGRLWPS
jgi:hypothetical protein